MRLIGLLGKAGSGKSTLAEYLVKKYGATRFSFAGPLKELAIRLLEFSKEQVYGTLEQKETVDPRYGISPRVFMQRLGQGVRDIIYPNVWIEACFENMKTVESDIYIKTENAKGREAKWEGIGKIWDGPLFVIDDVRYPNEVSYIKEKRGKILKLICTDDLNKLRETHPSEAQVDMIDPSFIDHIISCGRS